MHTLSMFGFWSNSTSMPSIYIFVMSLPVLHGMKSGFGAFVDHTPPRFGISLFVFRIEPEMVDCYAQEDLLVLRSAYMALLSLLALL
jgi:hypothetical protein